MSSSGIFPGLASRWIPNRHVYRLVLMHCAGLVVDDDLCGTLDHHPVLGTVMVLLQRELTARLHHDALDLIARTGIDALVVSPRAMDTFCSVASRRPIVERGNRSLTFSD